MIINDFKSVCKLFSPDWFNDASAIKSSLNILKSLGKSIRKIAYFPVSNIPALVWYASTYLASPESRRTSLSVPSKNGPAGSNPLILK